MLDQVAEIDSEAAACHPILRHAASSLEYSRVWALGSPAILDAPLLGFLCSERCPGNIVLAAYDLARVLRDTGVPIAGGFHSPMERECLDLLLRGTQPIVICPARTIMPMRMPRRWRDCVRAGRGLIISPFAPTARSPTAALAAVRNRFVAMLSRHLFVVHAAPGGRLEALCREWIAMNREVLALSDEANAHLSALGVTLTTPDGLLLRLGAEQQ